jgi:hypothetical protein
VTGGDGGSAFPRASAAVVLAVLAALAGCSAFGADTSGGGAGPSADGATPEAGSLEGGSLGDATAGGDSGDGGAGDTGAGDAGTGDCLLALDVSTASPPGWTPILVGGTVTAGTNSNRQSLLVDAPSSTAQATLSHGLPAMPSAVEIDAYVTAPASPSSAGGTLVTVECTAPTVSMQFLLDGLSGLAVTVHPLAALSYNAIGSSAYGAYHTFRFTFSGATVDVTVDKQPVTSVTAGAPFTNALGCSLTVGANLAASPSPPTPARIAYSRVCVR